MPIPMQNSDADTDDQYKKHIYHARHALPKPSHYIPPIPLYLTLSLQSHSIPPITIYPTYPNLPHILHSTPIYERKWKLQTQTKITNTKHRNY